jgi:hypothetical protein
MTLLYTRSPLLWVDGYVNMGLTFRRYAKKGQHSFERVSHWRSL